MPYWQNLMLVAFRCDASVEIGGGHVARCLTLARELITRGANILFLCRNAPPSVADAIRATPGIEFVPLDENTSPSHPDPGLPLAHSHWLRVSQTQDALDTGKVMTRLGKPDWLVVDHYALDARWEKSVQPLFGKTLVIDDLDDRPHEADLLLDQNLFLRMDQRYSEHAPTHCRLLLGPRYALLRPEFSEARSTLGTRSGKLEKLLVTFGSYDPMNLTLDALQGIEDAVLHELKTVDVVVGSETPHLESITNYCKIRPGYQIHVQTSNMAALMTRADLAIGASGATTWERCCLGLPSIVFAVADNQLPIAEGCDKAGAVVYLGRTPTAVRDLTSSSLRQLSKNPEKLREMNEIGIRLADGLGAQRVCDAMA